MKIKKVYSVYFSATGTTKKIVSNLGNLIADRFDCKQEMIDFTPHEARKKELSFSRDDLVILGTPVYAGRVPNVLLDYLSTMNANGAVSVPVVLYGNRDYDDALIELKDILDDCNFKTIAAAAFIGEHSFSNILAKDRPDLEDMNIVHSFSEIIYKKINDLSDRSITESTLIVKGKEYPYGCYYKPRDRHGNHINILKVKPVTNDDCNDCKLCADICPMNSIDRDDINIINGICIKCCACVKNCPKNAKYFIDEGYIYHKEELEEMYTYRKEPEIFF